MALKTVIYSGSLQSNTAATVLELLRPGIFLTFAFSTNQRYTLTADNLLVSAATATTNATSVNTTAYDFAASPAVNGMISTFDITRLRTPATANTIGTYSTIFPVHFTNRLRLDFIAQAGAAVTTNWAVAVIISGT